MTGPWPDDVFTEPPGSADTLSNLGPLRAMAGVWVNDTGLDEHPVAEGGEEDKYVERIELQPIDMQTNGPQLFFGLRYHTHVVKPGEVQTFHDQVGYWLWEPATKTVILSLAIPRAQVALAGGTAEPDAPDASALGRTSPRFTASAPSISSRRSAAPGRRWSARGWPFRSSASFLNRACRGSSGHGLAARRSQPR